VAVPLSYNLRNLLVRKTTSLMTALGIGLTVAVLLGVMGLLAGLERSFQSSGHPLQLLVLRKGSTAELNSVVTREQFQVLRAKEGIQVQNGEPLISHELVTVVNLPLSGGAGDTNINVRGLSPTGIRLRSEIVRLVEGRWFATGQRELTVGKGVVEGNEGVGIGRQIQIGSTPWTVVGVFDAGATAFQGEIWGDGNQLGADAGRTAALSSALLRAAGPVALRTLIHKIAEDQQLSHEATPEVEYYLRQTESGRPLQLLGTLVAIFMAVGSVFAAMNTMYAAVARRAREIGVLRVLGFSRPAILLSFMVESLLLSLAGGLLACLAVLPFHGLTNRIGNFVTFSQSLFEFRVTSHMIGVALVFAAGMGLFGGLWPARAAARKDVLNALRDL
jgi:putative ABC transport system permease protein